MRNHFSLQILHFLVFLCWATPLEIFHSKAISKFSRSEDAQDVGPSPQEVTSWKWPCRPNCEGLLQAYQGWNNLIVRSEYRKFPEKNTENIPETIILFNIGKEINDEFKRIIHCGHRSNGVKSSHCQFCWKEARVVRRYHTHIVQIPTLVQYFLKMFGFHEQIDNYFMDTGQMSHPS